MNHTKKTWVYISRVTFLVALDAVLIFLSVLLAFWSRYDFTLPIVPEEGISDSFPVFALGTVISTILVMVPLKLYNSLWAFAGVRELLHILKTALIIALIQIVATAYGLFAVPRAIPILFALYFIALISASRFSYRLVRNLRRNCSNARSEKRTMLIGAGDAGMLVLREFQNSINSRNRVVCFIDDDYFKQGKYINNVKVVGTRNEIANAVRQYKIEEIVFAIPSASVKLRKEILDICQKTGCKLKIMPGVSQLANGEVKIQKIRDVSVLDLLGRDSVKVDLSEIAAYIQDKVVLVTGGGGSIGSELCRQIAKLSPSELVIFDIYENNAYEIQQELRRAYPELKLSVQIGSVRDEERVNMLFERYQPEIVFHAAAHKHVPLMEDSPNEAIKNNVFGTYHVAKAADRFGTKTFVLISTDKAVNPTNIMGASKRMCEMIVQTMAEHSKTRFVAVRFGNVLGSNGSVIPLFRKQIEEGGPVTVTHPDIIRYFMTIPEAVSLVLQAGAYANRGEIFVLDMGEPVRIDDLARNLIRLSGFEPDVDIPVKYTGLRPGEKLYEEMLMSEEGLRSTANHMIHIGSPLEIDEERFLRQLSALEVACQENSPNIRKLVSEIVSTYRIPTGV